MNNQLEISIVIGILAVFVFAIVPIAIGDDYYFIDSPSNGGNGTGGMTECNNVGVGDTFICIENTSIDLRSFVAGDGIYISNTTDTVYLSSGVFGRNIAVDGSPVFFGNTLSCPSSTGVCLDFRSIATGDSSGLFVTHNDTHVIITNLAPDNTICASVGSYAEVYKDGECNFRDIKGSADISVVQGTNDITIDYNGTLVSDDTSCANVGTGSQIYKDGECNFRTILGSSDISVTQQTNTVTIDFNGTSGSSKLIGQESGQVYLAVTKTNIGTGYVDIYTTAFAEEDMMRIDFRNASYFDITYIWDYVGTGSQQVRWVDASNNANVLWEDSTFTSDRDAGASGWIAIPSWADNVFTIEWQGKSTVAGDDPIAYGYRIATK